MKGAIVSIGGVAVVFLFEIYSNSPQVMRSPVSLTPDSILFVASGYPGIHPKGPKIAGIWHICVTHGFIGTFHLKGDVSEALQKLMPNSPNCLTPEGPLKSPKILVVKLIRSASKYVTNGPNSKFFFRFLVNST